MLGKAIFKPSPDSASIALTNRTAACKQLCMTNVISLRIRPEKVAAIDRRAADSGLNRTTYILRLVEADLARPIRTSKRRFASGHLLGKFESRGSTNRQVRAALKALHEKNR